MERSGENDPLEEMINGDQATEQDILLLETVASDLLSGEEGVNQRYYTIAKDTEGPYVEVSTYIYEDSPDEVPHIAVGLIDENMQPLFRIEFDSTDKVLDPYFDERVLHDTSMSSALNTVIQDTTDNQERQLLDNLYGFIKTIEDGTIPEFVGDNIFRVDGLEQDYDSVADGFRYLVDAKYVASVRIKEFGITYGQNSSLQIVSHEAISGTIPEDGPCKLYIEFEDRDLGMGYYYEHGQSDDCDVTASHLSEALNNDESETYVRDSLEVDYDDEGDLAAEAMIRMYKGNLAKLHIDLLIAQLVEAELQNSLPMPE